MFDLFTILSGIFLIKEIIKEKMQKPAPANQRFDWDKYYADVNAGVNCMEVVKRRQNGYYNTTEPVPQPKYQNRLKQAMWEQYQKDLQDCPEYAALKIKHGGYGGFVFDDTES